jgi:hypothetical protein
MIEKSAGRVSEDGQQTVAAKASRAIRKHTDYLPLKAIQWLPKDLG